MGKDLGRQHVVAIKNNRLQKYLLPLAATVTTTIFSFRSLFSAFRPTHAFTVSLFGIGAWP